MTATAISQAQAGMLTAPPQDTINAALRRAATETPDRVFLDFGGEIYRFADIDRLATEMAHGLLAAGVKPGEPVATILKNSLWSVVCWFAINKIMAIYAPANTAFKGDYLHSQVEDCGASVVIVDHELTHRVREIADRLPALRHVFSIDGMDSSQEGVVSYRPHSILMTGNFTDIPDEARPETVSMLVYTSGTTGKSKGCMIPHNQVANMGWGGILNRGITADDVIFTPLPLFHLNAIGATIATCLIARCRATIVEKFSVSGFWPEVKRSGATIAGMLGSMVELIANAPDSPEAAACFGQLRQVNAAPFPPATLQKWETRFGVKGAGSRAYGMTEAATISTLRPGDGTGPDNSSGRVGYDFDVMIADDNGLPVPVGTAGEILCRPNRPNIMFRGYWNRFDETIAAFRDMWFHTGDIARLDDNGFLFFLDRKKDYIRRRGENISTMEVEAIFRKHPAIKDVAVHSVLSPLGEDDVKITAEINPDVPVSEEELCRWSIDQLPYFAIPLYIEFREELPRGATGKVLKHQLRDEGKTATTWDREEAGLTFEKK